MDSWFNQTFRWVQMFQYRWDVLIKVKQIKLSVIKVGSQVALCCFPKNRLQKHAFIVLGLIKMLSQYIIYMILGVFGILFLHRKPHVFRTFGTVTKATAQ